MTAEWQPIETAPKDGRDVLVANIDANVGRHVFIDNWNRSENRWDDTFADDTRTHWMPLPEPPK